MKPDFNPKSRLEEAVFMPYKFSYLKYLYAWTVYDIVLDSVENLFVYET